jgi:rRNA maturation endonuclease Nob1
MPSNLDLRKWQDSPEVEEAFSRLVSGKVGYKTIILKDKLKQACKNCGFELSGEEKFCPECGTKIIQEEKQQKIENK